MTKRDDKPQWKDSTSYRQGEPYPRTPRSWRLEVGPLRLFVSNGHIWFPGQWVGDVAPFHGDPHTLKATNEADAKAEIIAEAKDLLARAMAELDKAV